MKLTTWIDVRQEVEVDIPLDDVVLAFDGDPEKSMEVRMMDVLNILAAFFRKVTDEMIAKRLNEGSRQIVANFLREQAQRFWKEQPDGHHDGN